jgi:oligoendopeptidase F
MTEAKVRTRNEIADQYKWNAESVFPNAEAWEQEVGEIQKVLPQFERFRGRLAEGPQVLLEAMTGVEDLMKQVVYSHLARSR